VTLKEVNIKHRLAAGMGIVLMLLSSPALAVKVGDITRLKGSRRNTLVGFGLVTGLGKNGDQDFGPTMRALAKLHERFASPVTGMEELEEIGVAVVSLTARLPEYGVREGDTVDVEVTAVGSAKSINGGRLLITPLVSPHRLDAPPFGFAEGLVRCPDTEMLAVGVVKRGGVMEEDVLYTFLARGRELPYKLSWIRPDEQYLTLLINDSHAGAVLANTIAMTINGWTQKPGKRLKAIDDPLSGLEDMSMAADPRTVLVRMPRFELLNPMAFIDEILQTPVIDEGAGEARVTINRTKGTIVISGDVEISPVAISVKGISIMPVANTVVGQTPRGPFVPLETKKEKSAKLADLVANLNKLQVPPEVMIDIIEEIHKAGKLHGKLIRESD